MKKRTSSTSSAQSSALAALEWQVAMGADEAVDVTPKSKRAPKAGAESAAPSRKAGAAANLSGAPLVQESRALADAATTLDDLRKAVAGFDGLAIKKTAKNCVFSDGNPTAKVMCIGEAPGANEDEEGIPFCGASGKLLDTMLAGIGLSRKDNFYITNTIFWRPPGNRKPTDEELAICKPFVEKHIALINPDVLILIGGTATLALLETKLGITQLRKQTHSYSNGYIEKPIPAYAIFHPSFLLRQPSQKKTMWFDLLNIEQLLSKNTK